MKNFKKFYDHVEPRLEHNGEDEEMYVFDNAQKEEDQEIGYYPKSHPSKRVNSIPTPLHHKTFNTRQGKNNNKKRKNYQNNGSNNKSQGLLPLRQEGQGYGIITKFVGARVCKLYSYTTGQSDFNGYILKHNIFATKGNVVLYRERIYQPNKVDIIHVYSDEERQKIVDEGELITKDFFQIIPVDVIKKNIVDLLQLPDGLSTRAVCKNWSTALNDFVYRKFDVKEINV